MQRSLLSACAALRATQAAPLTSPGEPNTYIINGFLVLKGRAKNKCSFIEETVYHSEKILSNKVLLFNQRENNEYWNLNSSTLIGISILSNW